MTDTIDLQEYTDEQNCLHGIVWNSQQDIVGQDNEGYVNGPQYGFEFVSGFLGGLPVTRDMLVQVLTEAQVANLEAAMDSLHSDD